MRNATLGERFGRLIAAFVFFLILPLAPCIAQNRDTIATAKIHNAHFTTSRDITFDVLLRSNSTSWRRFANATFEIEFLDTAQTIDASDYSISYVPGSSNLRTAPMAGNRPASDAYTLATNIRQGRVSIVAVGPDSIADCAVFPLDTDIRIGTFVLHASDGAYLSNKFAWRMPAFDFQACAFKLEQDSLLTDFIKYASAAENMEMDDNSHTAVRYLVDSGKDPVFEGVDFQAKYASNRKVQLLWDVTSEAYNLGYIISRGLKPYGGSMEEVVYSDTVVDYRKHEFDSLKGKGTAIGSFHYEYNYDTVQYRGEEYCYRLHYQDMRDSSIRFLDSACVYIPSSVITHAEAKPNPFSIRTTIEYLVDDDVYMTAKVFDITGELVQVLIDNEYRARTPDREHPHTVDFTVNEKASQGLYEVVLFAKPVDDPAVESSIAVVKLQLVK